MNSLSSFGLEVVMVFRGELFDELIGISRVVRMIKSIGRIIVSCVFWNGHIGYASLWFHFFFWLTFLIISEAHDL